LPWRIVAIFAATIARWLSSVARQSGWEDSDNQDENPGVAAHA
jgi:hypothetical protein